MSNAVEIAYNKYVEANEKQSFESFLLPEMEKEMHNEYEPRKQNDNNVLRNEMEQLGYWY